MIFGAISMIVFWGGFLWLGFYLIRGLSRFPERDRQQDPHEIARRRLASGDIGEEEYERISAKLRR